MLNLPKMLQSLIEKNTFQIENGIVGIGVHTGSDVMVRSNIISGGLSRPVFAFSLRAVKNIGTLPLYTVTGNKIDGSLVCFNLRNNGKSVNVKGAFSQNQMNCRIPWSGVGSLIAEDVAPGLACEYCNEYTPSVAGRNTDACHGLSIVTGSIYFRGTTCSSGSILDNKTTQHPANQTTPQAVILASQNLRNLTTQPPVSLAIQHSTVGILFSLVLTALLFQQ